MVTLNRRSFLHYTKYLMGSMVLFNHGFWSPLNIFAQKHIKKTHKAKSRILVLFASHHESTAEIAIFMGKKLKSKGIQNDVLSVEKHIDWGNYDGLILGAPIHRGQWMESVIEFVKHNRESLMKISLACYCTCMSKAKQPPSESTTKEVQSYRESIMELLPWISPTHVECFAGKLDYQKCGFFAKLALKLIMRKNRLEAGDYRDWQMIENWLNRVANQMVS